ncbi:NADPH-dependent FMN reductase [Siminovitchia sp. FSL W7-1587]|uniref:NADPH-dependent FMN reductase n=1 Tax=Siminovitchia sp. FSL W7-1587 TaxID=2954699 RepID=UPI0030CEC3B8
MSDIVIISGSPSEFSRSGKILDYLGRLLEREHFSIKHVSVKDIPPEDLVYGNVHSPAIQKVSLDIQETAGVIVGSPVYKAAYSGVLKTLFDLLPQDVFKNIPVLPLMTGGSPGHLLAIEFSLKPLIASLKGKSLQGLYFLDSQINREQKNPIIDEESLLRTKKQLYEFIEIVKKNKRLASSL